jgi:hypothetical protein
MKTDVILVVDEQAPLGILVHWISNATVHDFGPTQ